MARIFLENYFKLFSNKMTAKREIYLQFAPNGETQNLSLTSSQINSIGKFTNIQFSMFTFPLTYYNIDNHNNTFLLKEDNSSWILISLNRGNYTSSQLCSHLKTQIEQSAANGTYTVSVNEVTGVLQIIVSGSVAYFSIAFNTGDLAKEKLFGVIRGTPGATYTIENPPTAAQIPNAMNYTSSKSLPSTINITEINRYGILRENNTGSWLQFALTLGEYTRSAYLTHLLAKLTDVGILTYSGSILQNGKMSISVATGNTFSVAFTENIQATEIIWGVNPGTAGALPYIQNPPDASQFTNVVSGLGDYPTQLWGPDQLILTSSSLDKIILGANIDINIINNVIMRVPVTSTPFSQQTYVTDTSYSCVASTFMPSSIDINILDEFGNSINFNGGVCYLTIRVW